jgi:hypothetical protein
MSRELLQQALNALEHPALPVYTTLRKDIRAHLAAQPAPVPDFFSRQSPLVQDEMGIAMVKAWSVGGRTDAVHPDFQCGFEAGWESAAPVPCARNELVTAIHSLASNFENSLYAFRDDTEARRKATGDIAHAMKIAAKHNQNGPGCSAAPVPMIGASTHQQVFDALEDAHWLSGPPHERIKQLIAERESAAPVPVPHGWKLVPVEPTPEMALAYGKTKAETGSDYDAMKAAIAASPEKP